MIHLVQLQRQFEDLRKEIISTLDRTLTSGNYILGQEVQSFENEVGEYLNVRQIISVANGTDALVIALHALGIGEGDEVITTPFTFFATAEAISRVGAKPVFVDIDPKTYNIDPAKIEKHITSFTKAILPVHLFGQSCDIEQIMHLARKHQLYVIEDACQAFGAHKNGKKLGTIGDVGCFSFFPTKNLSTIGDGGLIVTKHDHIATRIKKLRHHGSFKKYHHDEVGYNSRLDEIHAAILRICLKHIDKWNHARIEKAALYDDLAKIEGISLPLSAAYGSHVFHLYCIESDEKEAIRNFLMKNDVATGSYYPLPLHLQPVYAHLGYKLGDFPIAEEKAERLFALPIHPYLYEEEQKKVIRLLKTFRKEEGI